VAYKDLVLENGSWDCCEAGGRRCGCSGLAFLWDGVEDGQREEDGCFGCDGNGDWGSGGSRLVSNALNCLTYSQSLLRIRTSLCSSSFVSFLL
jgi:hypothetical protein